MVFFAHFYQLAVAAFNINFSQDGIEGVPSNLATAIHSVVVILMAWAMFSDQ